MDDECVLPVDTLLAMLEDCGLAVELSATGLPRLTGNTKRATPELIRQLRANREALIQMLQGSLEQQFERDGHLVRLPGSAWVSMRDLVPCGDCQGVLFWRSADRLACKRCLKPKPGEMVLGEVDVRWLKETLSAA